jgi:hypothetical protein
MLKWFIGVSAALIIALFGFGLDFIKMGYSASDDIVVLFNLNKERAQENAELKAEYRALKAISERTEKNTEEIRNFLLNKATQR